MDKAYRTITTQAACVDEFHRIWLFSNTFNALFCMDLKTREITFVTSFYKEPFFLGSLYTKAIYHEKKIYFIPCQAKHIAIFDVIARTVRYLYLENDVINYNAVHCGSNEILLFPVKYSHTAYRFRLSDESLRPVFLDFGNYEEQFAQKRIALFCGDDYKNGEAGFVLYGTNQCLRYNVEGNQWTMTTIDGHGNWFFATQGNNKDTVFLSQDGMRLFMENVSGGRQEIKLPGKSKQDIFSNGCLMAYTQLHLLDDGALLCVPTVPNPLLFLQHGELISMSVKWDKVDAWGKNTQPLVVSCQAGEKLYILPYQGATMLVVGRVSQQIEYIPMKLSTETFEKILEAYCSHGSPFGDSQVIFSEENYSLRFFLKALDSLSNRKMSLEVSDCGESIYRAIMQ